MAIMDLRRAKQLEYNKKRGIKPESIKSRSMEFAELRTQAKRQGLAVLKPLPRGNMPRASVMALASEIESRMKDAADNLNFELAVELRDRLFEIREMAGVKGKGTKAQSSKGAKL
jgi:excinuclease ABC subunit B